MVVLVFLDVTPVLVAVFVPPFRVFLLYSEYLVWYEYDDEKTYNQF